MFAMPPRIVKTCITTLHLNAIKSLALHLSYTNTNLETKIGKFSKQHVTNILLFILTN